MGDNNITWYILFPNHHMGLRLKKELDSQDIKAMISPTPREASTSCGISLIVEEKDIPAIKRIIEGKHIQVLDIVSIQKKEWKYRSC